ncbi:MAG TPA: ATP-binding protein [Mycobacteriales bacterium]|nr:ATP-binding protein [Mycobacteriales bacterium]
MSTIEVRFSPLTSHVRTARLVALSVARRAGMDEDQLDEVRLAVGETCSRAVGVHIARGTDEPVTMRMADDRAQFSIEVINVGTLADDPTQSMDLVEASNRALAEGAPDGDAMPPGFGLAVVSGLVEDLFVTSDGGVTTVRMIWPLLPASIAEFVEPTAS